MQEEAAQVVEEQPESGEIVPEVTEANGETEQE